jgi:cytochrome c peroxidase
MWAQALTPIESQGEMGSTRLEAVRYVTGHATYGPAYVALFGPGPSLDALPKRAGPFADQAAKAAWAALDTQTRKAISTAYANVGKTLGAFQRELSPTQSRFDRYVRALVDQGSAAADQILSEDERAGLKLFLDDGRTQCMRCHNGPLFTNFGFHNADTGRTAPPDYDLGRSVGIRAARIDPFNCEGDFSDAPPGACKELRFADLVHTGGRMRGAFKVPTLRNVGATGPYMHDGRFATLEAVVCHCRNPTPAATSRHELAQTRLTDGEAGQLVAFLHTLTSERRPAR